MANAIGWVQFRISGSLKTLGGALALYTLAIVVFLALQFRFSYNIRRDASTWSSILLYLQMAAMILFGSFRVIGGIRNDVKLGMMESHRMMPITGVHAVIGYLSTPAIQLAGFTLVNLALGAILAMQAGLPVENLFFSHGLIWAMALVLWLIVALGALVIKQASLLISVIVLMAFLSQGMIVVLFPSVLVLSTPLIDDGVLSLTRIHGINRGQSLALLLQLLVGLQFFFAAARKYQYAERPAFDGLRGLMLLFTWVGLYLIAMLDKGDFKLPEMFRWFSRDDFIPTHLVSTLLAGFLIALVPIASAARRAAAGTWRGISPWALLTLTVIISSLPVLGVLYDPPHSTNGVRITQTLLLGAVGMTIQVASAYVITLYCMLRFMPGNRPILKLNLVVLWLALTWLGPLIIELIYQALLLSKGGNNGGPSPLMGLGALGSLVEIWAFPQKSFPLAGILAQWGTAAIFGFLLWRKKRRIAASQLAAEQYKTGNHQEASSENTENITK